MNLFRMMFWMLVGAITAFAFLRMQSWSVHLITPERPKLSSLLVVGGAVLRWILIFLLLFLALHQSFLAALAQFVTFMVVRLILLFFFRTQIMPEFAPITGTKD
jgi:hypothetical protein